MRSSGTFQHASIVTVDDLRSALKDVAASNSQQDGLPVTRLQVHLAHSTSQTLPFENLNQVSEQFPPVL